jgi:hypothetical protein
LPELGEDDAETVVGFGIARIQFGRPAIVEGGLRELTAIEEHIAQVVVADRTARL